MNLNKIDLEKVDYRRFYDYFLSLYGIELKIANWHMNGELESFDNFFDSALEYALCNRSKYIDRDYAISQIDLAIEESQDEDEKEHLKRFKDFLSIVSFENPNSKKEKIKTIIRHKNPPVDKNDPYYLRFPWPHFGKVIDGKWLWYRADAIEDCATSYEVNIAYEQMI